MIVWLLGGTETRLKFLNRFQTVSKLHNITRYQIVRGRFFYLKNNVECSIGNVRFALAFLISYRLNLMGRLKASRRA